MASSSTSRPRARFLVLFALAGCDGFETPPALGTVRLRLSESDSSALVAPVAAPAADALTRRAALRPDGTFELASVLPGDYSLFVVATADKALRVQATVRAWAISDLGMLWPEQGGFVKIRLSQPSLASATLVTALGTPYVDQKVDTALAGLTIGPLPEGCYDMVARANGAEHHWNSCVGKGEWLNKTVSFRAPPAGCIAAGSSCPAGLVCARDSFCVACLKESDCAAGLTCHQHSCVGSPNACASCASDDQCGEDNRCTALGDQRAVCIVPCSSDGTCGLGFVCGKDGFCLPESQEARELED